MRETKAGRITRSTSAPDSGLCAQPAKTSATAARDLMSVERLVLPRRLWTLKRRYSTQAAQMNRLLVLVSLAVFALACPEKKVEPPPKPPEPPKPAPVLAEAEPQADKECAASLDPGPSTDVTIGARAAKAAGSHL